MTLRPHSVSLNVNGRHVLRLVALLDVGLRDLHSLQDRLPNLDRTVITQQAA